MARIGHVVAAAAAIAWERSPLVGRSKGGRTTYEPDLRGPPRSRFAWPASARDPRGCRRRRGCRPPGRGLARLAAGSSAAPRRSTSDLRDRSSSSRSDLATARAGATRSASGRTCRRSASGRFEDDGARRPGLTRAGRASRSAPRGRPGACRRRPRRPARRLGRTRSQLEGVRERDERAAGGHPGHARARPESPRAEAGRQRRTHDDRRSSATASTAAMVRARSVAPSSSAASLSLPNRREVPPARTIAADHTGSSLGRPRPRDVPFRRALQDAAAIEVLEDREHVPATRSRGVSEGRGRERSRPGEVEGDSREAVVRARRPGEVRAQPDEAAIRDERANAPPAGSRPRPRPPRATEAPRRRAPPRAGPSPRPARRAARRRASGPGGPRRGARGGRRGRGARGAA